MGRTASLGAALGVVILAWSFDAGAVTLTTSEAAFFASGAVTPFAQTIDGVDNTTFTLPTVSSVTLGGQTIGLSPTATVTPPNAFPFTLSNGFTGDLLVPSSGSAITFALPAGLTALAFDVAPFSSSLLGPFTVSVSLSAGNMASVSLPGGDFGSGMTDSAFFGFYGGPITSLTISSTDPNGFGVAFDVPEPGSIALMLTGVGLLAGLRRRVG